MKKKLQNSTRAFILRITLSFALLAVGFFLLASSLKVQSGLRPVSGGPNVAIPAVAVQAEGPASFDADVRTLRQVSPQFPQVERERPELIPPPNLKSLLPEARTAQEEVPNAPVLLLPMPTPSVNVNGMSFTDSCTGGPCGTGHPPDPDGDVGLNYYILSMNEAVGIYNKSGSLLASFTENSLFAGTGLPQCDGQAFGDPQTVYDYLNDRWILSWFAFTINGGTGNQQAPVYQCFAASKTNNPVSGGWWLYAVRVDPGGTGLPPAGTIDDYPKLGLWIDCLYMGANAFSSTGAFSGTEFWSFSYNDMEAGAALTPAVAYVANTSDPFTPVPATIHGNPASSRPAAGTPGYFVSESQTAFAYEVRKFTAGTDCGAGGSLGAATNVSQTSYANVPGVVVPQPNTTTRLDSVDDRLKQKVQYRKVGAAESLWVVHNVQPSSMPVTPQWAQINVTGGTIGTTPVQQQIYEPDATLYRWMPSIAADNAGDVALGYSTSNGTSPNFPSIAYSGRLVGDTANQLPETERQMVAGTGSQIFTCGGAACTRWGDYTEMEVDPSDDCTFWYTNMYYSSQTNGNSGNDTLRIGAFKFPSCTAVPMPTIVSAVSRFTHGAGAGTFDLPLSTTSRVVEPRTDFTNNFKIIFTFNVPVNSGTASMTGTGSVGSTSFSGNTMTINLTGITDQQTVTVKASNVSGPGAGTRPATTVQIGFLIGDVTGDGVINAGDTVVVRNNAGVTLDNTNFQNDVNTDGAVNVGDTQIVRANSGHFLP